MTAHACEGAGDWDLPGWLRKTFAESGFGGPRGPGGPSQGHRGWAWGPSGGEAWGRGPRQQRGPRAGRGDVRSAVLALLAEGPMHGYQIIQEIARRSGGAWKPSPGSVYPTLQLLDDEGLISASKSHGSKKLFELTDEGRAVAEKVETAPWDEITEGADPGHMNLRAAVGQLFGAVAQSAHTASADQQQRIVEILNNARREVYGILGED